MAEEIRLLSTSYEARDGEVDVYRRVFVDPELGIGTVDGGPHDIIRVRFLEQILPRIVFPNESGISGMTRKEIDDDETAIGFARVAIQQAQLNPDKIGLVVSD